MVKTLPINAGEADLIPESGRLPGEGNGNHSSILAWRAAVHGVTKSQTRLIIQTTTNVTVYVK